MNKYFTYNKFFFCFILTLSLVIVSCNFISAPKLIDIDNIDINDINEDTLQLNISLQLENINSFKLKAKDITFDIEVNNIYLGNGFILDEVRIESHDT